jgi:hypothetical protein
MHDVHTSFGRKLWHIDSKNTRKGERPKTSKAGFRKAETTKSDEES